MHAYTREYIYIFIQREREEKAEKIGKEAHKLKLEAKRRSRKMEIE
jgi:hypothetical protein